MSPLISDFPRQETKAMHAKKTHTQISGSYMYFPVRDKVRFDVETKSKPPNLYRFDVVSISRFSLR